VRVDNIKGILPNRDCFLPKMKFRRTFLHITEKTGAQFIGAILMSEGTDAVAAEDQPQIFPCIEIKKVFLKSGTHGTDPFLFKDIGGVRLKSV